MTKHESKNRLVLTSLLATAIFPALAAAQPVCVAPALSDQQVKDIIDKARETRTDLGAPFPKYRWTVRRQGCHYVYIETGLPEAPDYRQSFKLNQYGAIVDADNSRLKCPDKVLTESELAEIVTRERKKRQDLPPALPNARTRVQRLRCLYMYFEYAQPERKGDFQVFTIDPLGELMEFYRSQPY
jgi:hypothetical protein